MDPQITIDDLLANMRDVVLHNPDGQLLWGFRLRLWKRLADCYGSEGGFRFNTLAFLTSRMAAVHWDDGEVPKDCTPAFLLLMQRVPSGILRDFRLSLLGSMLARQRVMAWRSALLGLHWIDEIYAHRTGAVLSTLVTATVRLQHPAHDFVRDSMFDGSNLWDDEALGRNDELKDLDDPLAYETEYWASYAWSVVDDEGRHSTERRREFWLHWLDELVPVVLKPLQDVVAILDGLPT